MKKILMMLAPIFAIQSTYALAEAKAGDKLNDKERQITVGNENSAKRGATSDMKVVKDSKDKEDKTKAKENDERDDSVKQEDNDQKGTIKPHKPAKKDKEQKKNKKQKKERKIKTEKTE